MKYLAIHLLIASGFCSWLRGQETLKPAVEAEETVYEWKQANNGAGPMWCYGSTCIVRHGDDVFVAGQETLPGVKPLNNVRWTLYKRDGKGWQLMQTDPKGRQREPCPLGVFDDGRLFLSTNPTLTPLDAAGGPANPHLLRFSCADLNAPPVPLQPQWVSNPGFNHHSYRGLGVDGVNHELVALNNYDHKEQHWAFLDRDGQWKNRGIISYPIRGCYEEVSLVNHVCHVVALGDAVEPVEEWHKWKLQKTGSTWDYVFRRMFYTQTPDIATTQFSEPVEIESVDSTAGHLRNFDLWVDRTGAAHVLYQKQIIQYPDMRATLLPGVLNRTSLEHCVLRDNKVVSRDTLVVAGDKAPAQEIPGWAHFHVTEDGRLFVLYYCSGRDAAGKTLSENRLMEILPEGKHTNPVKVGLKNPFGNFMTATVRSGSPPSHVIDVLGTSPDKPDTVIRYARIHL